MLSGGACLFLLALFVMAGSGKATKKTAIADLSRGPDAERITNLLDYMKSVDVASLPALPVERFALPNASMDVMRVRLEETYDIAGVGKDTVQLTGWIAVKHDNPRPAAGETEVKWGTAVSDTQFVEMDLRGQSKVFGPVQITLNPLQASVGQVGKLDLPPGELTALHKAYVAETTSKSSADLRDTAPPINESGFTGISASLQQMADAIEAQNPQHLLLIYDPNPNNTYFNASAGRTFKGAQNYVNFLAPQFRATALDVRFNATTIIQGVPNRWALVETTGSNIVRNRAGQLGSEVPWHLTQLYVYVGGNGRWLSKHDEFSTTIDPNLPIPQGPNLVNAACRAQTSASINMPKLNLKMETKSPVVWYSEVETIPPVGYTASISAMPTALISAGREVGTLTHGIVKFREVVAKVPLEGTNWQSASASAARRN
jgi:hypothetical protein